MDRCRGQLSGCAILISYEGSLAEQAHRLVWFCVCVLQQRPLQWLNEGLVNMHEGRTLPFTSVTSPDALAQRKMERNGKSKTLNSYLVPHACFASHCVIKGINGLIKLFSYPQLTLQIIFICSVKDQVMNMPKYLGFHYTKLHCMWKIICKLTSVCLCQMCFLLPLKEMNRRSKQTSCSSRLEPRLLHSTHSVSQQETLHKPHR